METTINKQSNIYIRDGWKNIIFDVLAVSFVVLFLLTAIKQLMAFQTLKEVLAASPLIGRQSSLFAYVIPGSETAISLLILVPKTRVLGVFASLSLLILFTAYLTYMVTAGVKLPCNCGGIIPRLSWTQHIGLNLILIAINIACLKLSNSVNRYNLNQIS